MARKKQVKRSSSRQTKRKRQSLFAYPAVIFLLLCAGVFLVAWTFKAGADTVLVKAKISAPFVTDPAVITSPADGTRFSLIPITVKGTCPANAAYVEIFRNGVMSGTAICSVGGTFELSTDLFANQNVLTAHVFNSTDDEGPVSTGVTVYYDVPQPPPGGGTSSKPPGSSRTTSSPTPAQVTSNPLILKTAFIYKGYYVGQQVEWPLEISGGSRPYAVSVNWGDGKTDIISRGNEGQFKITHTYQKAGGYHGSYEIKVKASDINGQKAYLQFFVIVNNKSNSGLAGSIFSKPPPSLGTKVSWLLAAWPAYAFVMIMAISYWLGEHEELIVLHKKGLLKR